MASFKLSFTAVLLCVAFSCCRGQGQGGGGGGAASGGGAAGAGGGGAGSGIGAVVPGTQDSVQIVAQAALCFDNKPILNGCLQAMGVNARGGISSGTGMLAPGAPAIMCSPPCFGHVTMMMSCVNSIFGNFVSYNPGLMQGVQAIFQMSCGNPNGPGGPGGPAGGGAGAGGASGGVGGGAAGGGAGGIPNTIPGGGAGAGGASGGVGGGAAGGLPNSIPGGGGGAGGASTGIVGGAGGGVGGGPAGGGAAGIPNSIGGAAAGAGGAAAGGGTVSSVGGAAGEGGPVSNVGGAAGGGGGISGGDNGTTTAGDVGAVSSSNSTNVVPLPPNAGSHVAVSNQSQPTSTSSADGPTFSLKGACSSVVLVTWAGAWLLLV